MANNILANSAFSGGLSKKLVEGNMPTDHDIVLLASNWVGDEAPYTYDITFKDHKNTEDKIAIMVGDNATIDEVSALQSMNIAVANWINKTTLRLKAYGEKATIDVPINVTISSISMKFADDSSLLIFKDMVVPVSAWIADSTYKTEGFGYSADIICQGVTEEYVPEVIFSVADAACGNFSSNSATFENVVRIYAKDVLSESIIVPTITCTIAAACIIGGTHGSNHSKDGTDPITPAMIGAAPAYSYVIDTMMASNWSGNTYSFELMYPMKSYDISIEVAPTATAEQFEAFGGAMICGSIDSNIATAIGDVPTVDIPIIIKVVLK